MIAIGFCEECAFFENFHVIELQRRSSEGVKGGQDGYCRRHAPGPINLPGTGEEPRPRVGLWPETNAGDWCGEWRAKEIEDHNDK